MSKLDKKKINITVQDIAESINISASTVSRALNNHPKISQLTKEKVWKAAKKMGYQPTIPAYMSPNNTKTICFIVPQINNSFYTDAINRIQEYVLKKNYNLLIAYSNSSISIEKALVKSIANLNFEGVIVGLFNKSYDLSHLQELLEQKVPTVLINKSEQELNVCKIIPDVSHGCYKAVNHLLSMGCKNICLLTGDIKNPFYADMIEGYQSALMDSDINSSEENIIISSLSTQDIKTDLNNFLNKSKLPDAIITPNIIVYTKVDSWLQSKGYSIPKDLLLLSFGTDSNDTDYSSNVSTIQVSGSKTGKQAVKKLFAQIESGDANDETVIITTKFIIKGSTMRI